MMRFLKPLAEIVFWMGLWICVPAGLLYPVVLSLAKHTQISAEILGNSYIYLIGALLLPTAFLVDWIYRRFFLRQRLERPSELNERRVDES